MMPGHLPGKTGNEIASGGVSVLPQFEKLLKFTRKACRELSDKL